MDELKLTLFWHYVKTKRQICDEIQLACNDAERRSFILITPFTDMFCEFSFDQRDIEDALYEANNFLREKIGHRKYVNRIIFDGSMFKIRFLESLRQ